MKIRTKTIGFAFGIISLFSVTSCSEERESIEVKRNDIVESVYSSITVEPINMYKVNSLITGFIEEIPLEEGDTVLPGQTLFIVRDIVSKSSSENAKLLVNQAKNNLSGETNMLEDLKLELKNLELKRKTDSLNYSRISKLYDKKLASKTEFEQAELIYTSSKNAYTSMKKKIARSERDLKISLEQARNNYVSSLSRSEESTVRSLAGGLVYSISKERGELVSMQETVAIIGDASKFKILMLIDEVDITSVKVGQRIIVTLEAYKGKTFDAKVTRIAPRMESRTQTFEVEGEFIESPEKLYFGLTGEGNIIVKERKNVLVIPREYLIGENEVETENGIKKVKVGAMNFTHVEVLDGLKENELLFKPE